MGQGIDGIVVDPREASSMEECVEAEFVRTLVAQAGLVISGYKPAAVFGFTPRAWKSDDASKKRTLSAQLFAAYAVQTSRYGVRLAWLADRHGAGAMLLAWRPSKVQDLLNDDASRELLAESGLPTASVSELMGALVGRLRSYYAGRADFPHVLGVVLGYPAEDVLGFMADGGRGAKVVGRWRCYGDVASAERRFRELGAAESRFKRLYSEGVPMRELLRMGAA